jgi:putative ABC transport system permease protein
MKTSLIPLAKQNLFRAKTNAFISIVGVGIAMGLYLFCAGLTQGVRHVVFDKVFIADSIQVVPKRVSVGIFETKEGPTLNAETLDALRAIKGVSVVYPRMSFAFPSGYSGSIDKLVNGIMKSKVMKSRNQRISFEIIADGVAPEMIAQTLKTPQQFADYGLPRSCSIDSACPTGLNCKSGQCLAQACDIKSTPSSCPHDTYCAAYFTASKSKKYRCEPPIPAVISEHLLEMYNGGIATAMNLPALSPQITDSINPVIPLTLGSSFMSRRGAKQRLTKHVKLVGISKNAIAIGLTIPLPYVQRLNTELRGEAAGQTFHSATLKITRPEFLDRIKAEVESLGLALGEDTEKAEQAGQVLRTVEVVLAMLALLILLVVAINLAQTFVLLIRQRRREIGLFRSLGATRLDILRLILIEACIIGFAGAGVAIVGSLSAAWLIDACLTFVPYFPYKPATLFAFELSHFMYVVLVSQLFCIGGAFIPARQAAQLSPADALSSI